MPDRKKAVPRPIADPRKDAQERFGAPFHAVRTWRDWQPWEVYVTTGQFEQLDGGYLRHCGPTALTNLLLTLDRRWGFLTRAAARTLAPAAESSRAAALAPAAEPIRAAAPAHAAENTRPVPADIFHTVAAIGEAEGFYRNKDVLHRFGGTYDLRAAHYIRTCFAHYGVPFSPRSFFPLEPEDFTKALFAGKLLYLELHRHPVYGNHHLLVYGAVELENISRTRRALYLLVADGWAAAPRYLRAEETSPSRAIAVGV